MSDDRLVAHGADVLGLIAGLLGYQPGLDHVVVLAVEDDGMLHAAAGITWIAPIGEGQDFADAMTDQMTTAWRDETGLTMVIVGYGHHGQERAMLLGEALATHDLQVGDVYAVAGSRYSAIDDQGRWTASKPVPDTGEALRALAGFNPAASRDEMLARYDPYPQPAWTLPTWTDLASQPPSERADRALHLLTDLAEVRGPRDPAQLAELAVLGGQVHDSRLIGGRPPMAEWRRRVL